MADRRQPASPETEYELAVKNAFGLPCESQLFEDGMSIFHILQSVDFTIDSVNTKIHCCSGSLVLDSEIIAKFFAAINDCPIWWRTAYRERSFDGIRDPNVVKWLSRLRLNALNVDCQIAE